MTDYCWDTSVFLALLKGNQDNQSPEEIMGLRAAVDDIHNRRANLVTSTLIFAEVLPAGMSEERYDVFRSFFLRENVSAWEVSASIAHRTGDVRTRAASAGKKTSTEDAVFIATALVSGCSHLHSFDPDHLRLAELFAEELTIVKPTGTQVSMDLQEEAPSES